MGASSPCSAMIAGRGRDGRERVLRDLGAGEDRRPLVQQADEAAHQAGFRLAALAEQDDVLVAENGVGELRDHRVVVTGDAGKQRLAGAQPGDEVAPELGLDGQHLMAAGPQGTEGSR
jgi:hypothetical protein